jgi:hypothetical protein
VGDIKEVQRIHKDLGEERGRVGFGEEEEKKKKVWFEY